MKISTLQYAFAEIVLAAITFMEFLNEYIRLMAAIAATITLFFAVFKFIRESREHKKKSDLMDLQIENEVRKRDLLKKQNNEQV